MFHFEARADERDCLGFQFPFVGSAAFSGTLFPSSSLRAFGTKRVEAKVGIRNDGKPGVRVRVCVIVFFS